MRAAVQQWRIDRALIGMELQFIQFYKFNETIFCCYILRLYHHRSSQRSCSEVGKESRQTASLQVLYHRGSSRQLTERDIVQYVSVRKPQFHARKEGFVREGLGIKEERLQEKVFRTRKVKLWCWLDVLKHARRTRTGSYEY